MKQLLIKSEEHETVIVVARKKQEEEERARIKAVQAAHEEAERLRREAAGKQAEMRIQLALQNNRAMIY